MAQGDIKIIKTNDKIVVEIKEVENPLDKLTETEHEIYTILNDMTQDCCDFHTENIIACAKALSAYMEEKNGKKD